MLAMTTSQLTWWRRTKRWVIPFSLTLAVLVLAVLLLYSTRFGKRLIAHGTGLFVHVPSSPVRFVLPEPTGPFLIGTATLHLVDSTRPDPWVDSRRRELMVSFWYPTKSVENHRPAMYMPARTAEHFQKANLEPLGIDPVQLDVAGVRTHAWLDAPVDASRGKLPVILYSPGGGQSRLLGTVLVEELASQGYVVVTVDHTYDCAAVEFPGGRLELAALPTGEGVLEKSIKVRVDDMLFILDQLEANFARQKLDAQPLPDMLAGALDLTKIGMLGFSAGGFTTAQLMHKDPRVDVGVNLDGSLGYHIAKGIFGDAAREGVDRPLMFIGAGLSGAERLPHNHRNAPDWKSLWSQSTGWKRDFYIPEGEHFSFSDHQVILPQLDEKIGLPAWLRKGMIGTADPNSIVASTRAYLAAFFHEHLRGQPQALLNGPSPSHPYIDFVEDGAD